MQITAYYTDHFVNQTIMQFLSKALNIELLHISKFKSDQNIFCSYGILRGNAEAINKSKNFLYLDHGFLESSSRSFDERNFTLMRELDGYFRIIKNDLYFNSKNIKLDNSRFKSLNIDLKDLNKNGEYIVLSEPTEDTLKFHGIKNWAENTINEIQKHTDRKIIFHDRFNKIPLREILLNAYGFVSLQSTAGFRAICDGVPAYFTHDNLKIFGDISNIEKRNLNHELLFMASNSQWRLKEFFSDEFREFIIQLNE